MQPHWEAEQTQKSSDNLFCKVHLWRLTRAEMRAIEQAHRGVGPAVTGPWLSQLQLSPKAD